MRAPLVHLKLGPLAFDEGLNRYVGSATADGERVEIHLSLDECHDEPALFRAAKERVVRLSTLIQAAKRHAAASLLEEINSQWLIPTERALSLAELVDRFEVRSLTVYPDGCDEIILGPEKLLSGHCVVISSDVTGQFGEASVAG